MNNRLLWFGLLCTLAAGILSIIINLAKAMPVEVDPYSHKAFSVVGLYLNATDGHIHVKGFAKNLLPETIYGTWPGGKIGFTIYFKDAATSDDLKSVDGLMSGPINPGAAMPFDVDSNYTQAQAYQFQYMKLYFCC